LLSDNLISWVFHANYYAQILTFLEA